MTPDLPGGRDHGHGAPAPGPRCQPAAPGQALSPAGRPNGAERAALDNPAGAATHDLVAIATHHQQPDPSQKLDTGHHNHYHASPSTHQEALDNPTAG